MDGRSVVDTAPRAPSRLVVQTQVVPRLLDIVRNERSDQMVAAALIGLGRLADAPADLHGDAVAAVTGQIASPNAHVRESAIIALGLFGTASCNGSLLALVEGKAQAHKLIGTTSVSNRTRAFAAHALGLAAVRMDDVGEEQRVALAMVDVLEGNVSGMADLPVAAVTTLGLIDLPVRTSVPPVELRSRDNVDHVLSSRHLARFVLPLTQSTVGARADRSVTLRALSLIHI